MKNKQKILFVSNSSADKINHILDAFQARNDLQTEVLHQYIGKVKKTFLSKIFDKLKIPLDIDKLNKRLLEKIEEFKPNILFVVKGNSIYPWILYKIKHKYPYLKIVSWSQDDMYAMHNRSFYYTLGIKYYDLLITQKSYNVDELKKLGAKKVFFQNKAYSKIYHKTCKDCEQTIYKYNVLFIGFAEKDRFEDMNYLAFNGLKVNIFGSGWDKKEFQNHHKNLIICKSDLIGKDYANAISCSKISLCFLRKANRDLQTSRSIEIPACGGFMIAERTDEHKKLFEENKEAVYFDSKEELLEKVKYYLTHEDERKKIAQAGYERTRSSGYSYDDRVKEIMEVINEL